MSENEIFMFIISIEASLVLWSVLEVQELDLS